MRKFAAHALMSTTLAMTIGIGCGAEDEVRESESAASGGNQFEVWLLDQSNTNGLTYGGTIHIWDGPRLMGGNAGTATETDIIDLGGAAAALCFASTGANPVRPHMIFFNQAHTHAVISFVASGHVLIMDGATRTPLACFRTEVGAGGARQAHAAFPSNDNTYILVANQNGKKLERIDVNYATNTFSQNAAATIDLANCVTPNGVPCQLAGVRPDNAPICPVLDSSSSLSFVTLRGGGLFVVDPRTTPMSIIAEYDNTTIHGNGCGGIEAGGSMFVDSGGALATNLFQFDVYRFGLSGYAASNPPNTPAPATIFSDNSDERDAHGMVIVKQERYLWVIDRAGNLAEVFDVATNAHVNTVSFATSASPDPSADLGDMAPTGARMFVSMRGPNPLSGDPHVSTGAVPGLGVIHVNGGGANGSMAALLPISNVDSAGVQRADAHGVRVRRK